MVRVKYTRVQRLKLAEQPFQFQYGTSKISEHEFKVQRGFLKFQFQYGTSKMLEANSEHEFKVQVSIPIWYE